MGLHTLEHFHRHVLLRNFLRFSVSILLVTLTGACPAAGQSPGGDTWTANEDMLVYYQAVNVIRTASLHSVDGREVMQQSLKAFIQTLDPYSNYWTPEEYAAYAASRSADFAGVGMELVAEPEGGILCVPYPDGPAAIAGVLENDRLISVDDSPVKGQPMQTIGARIRGEPGTTVVIGVERNGGFSDTLRVVRKPLNAASVVPIPASGISLLRIYRFSERTPDEVSAAIRSSSPGVPIVIDLRGAGGGGVFDAIDTARLFLPKESIIVEIRARESSTTYRNETSPAFPDCDLFVLQDRRTASAAELFIGALVGNQRATSLGERTFGKGYTQQIVPLLDGSALLLTDAELFLPDGSRFHETGLSPTIEIDEGTSIEEISDLVLKAARRVP